MDTSLEMCPNRVVAFLGKPCSEFTKATARTAETYSTPTTANTYILETARTAETYSTLSMASTYTKGTAHTAEIYFTLSMAAYR